MSTGRKLRTLLFSTLYPSSVRPTHGIFVETRLRELLASGEVETRVVAPVPWFPSRDPRFGDRARMAATPHAETYNGIEVLHPRYLLAPKVGMTTAPLTLALGARASVAKLLADGYDFDVIDAHYYYPDGIAAALLARWFNKPLVITARGTDLNLIPQYALPRRMIRWAAGQAQGSIGVCGALMDVLRDMGVPPARLHVMRNGVDLQRFRPVPQHEARAALGLPADGRLVLSVGHLVERKGHHVAIDALKSLPADVSLCIVGEGEERQALEARIAAAGLGGRAKLIGAVPNARLYQWYSAADVLVLASSREGWANVLLESMACGTPVVATRIWGTPEVVQDDVAGRLVAEREGAAFARTIEALLLSGIDRPAVRRYAEGFSWEATTRAQLQLFQDIAAGRKRATRQPLTGATT
ncbi:glycosyltransferase family 4 protein [Uliginosibacterium sp. H1]|uniref:glycosyltransferase family 4 protein n=1 Tax=Uliginosibacterium sp. H1 TaxID=3114757 RepID=UPI002E1935F1|nr:glycosyltransferase family 4 protein [Uliginosibacterium sp. H1]